MWFYIMDFVLFCLKENSTYVLGVVDGLESSMTINEQHQQNRGCYFSHASYASLGRFIFSDY